MLKFYIDSTETEVITKDLKIRHENHFTHFRKMVEGDLWVKQLYDYIIGESYEHRFNFEITGDYSYKGFFHKTDITIDRTNRTIKINTIREDTIYELIQQTKDKKHKIGDLNVDAEAVDYELQPTWQISFDLDMHKHWELLEANGYEPFSARAKATANISEYRYWDETYIDAENMEQAHVWIYIPYKDVYSDEFWGLYWYLYTYSDGTGFYLVYNRFDGDYYVIQKRLTDSSEVKLYDNATSVDWSNTPIIHFDTDEAFNVMSGTYSGSTVFILAAGSITARILSNKRTTDFSSWNNTTTYNVGDVRERNGEVYEALVQNTDKKPEDNSSYSNPDAIWLKRSNDTGETSDGMNNYINAYNCKQIGTDFVGTSTLRWYNGNPDIAIVATHDYSDTPTGYGKIRRGSYKGKYYKKPTGNYIPIMKDFWAEFSLWVEIESNYNRILQDYKTTENIPDNYEIIHLTDALLEKNGISDQITFTGSLILRQNHNPLLDNTQLLDLYLTPSTNVAYSEYYYPATANEISLQKIFDILEAMNIYWDIQYDAEVTNSYFLRFEHYFYFDEGKRIVEDNGNSLYADNIIGLDLTAIKNKNNIPWAETIKKITYEQSEKKKYTNYSSLDNKSKLVDAQMQVRNDLIQDSSEIKIPAYIDFIIVTRLGEDVQKDAWVLLNTTSSGEVEKTDINGHPIQNGSLTGNEILKNYHRYGLPGTVEIDNHNYAILSRERLAKEEYTGIANDFDPVKLVKTYAGNGKITDLTVYLMNRKIEMTIKHKL